ncbi:MAG: hypothetical protein IKT46_04335 [Clostridia bacterium]|nr:hypothetical protein [Clostridia bacterium]
MKKILLVICACALILSLGACKSKTPDTTDTPRETIDIDGDGISDGYVIEGIPADEIDEYDPDAVVDDDTPIINGADETQVVETLTEGGTDDGLWPTEQIPQDVPSYDNYTEMYPATHTESENSEEWYLSFDSSEKDYEDWLEKLAEEGYTESDKIVGFWGNGEQILNLLTEEVDGEFCVSIDIFKSKPVEYPEAVSSIFPEFTHTDSTLYGWFVTEGTPNTLSVSYACGKSFATDLNAYKQKLSDAGFTVTADSATKTVDGKTYTVRYGDSLSRYEDCLEYEY